jgi:hypothetical protein
VLAAKLTSVETTQTYITAVTNPLAATGGQDQEDKNVVAARLPALKSVMGQINGLNETVTYAESLAGIQRAKAVLVGNTIHLYCLSDPVSTLIAGSVLTDLEVAIADRLIMGYGIEVFNAQRATPTIEVTVYTTAASKTAIVQRDVREQIRSYINPLARKEDGTWLNPFGGNFRLSRIGFAMQNVSSIYDYIVTAPTDRIVLDADEVLIHTGTINVTVIGASDSVSYNHFAEEPFESQSNPQVN